MELVYINDMIKTDQTELIQVKRDYSKYKKELPEQLPITDLPLFDLESQVVQQTNLFTLSQEV